jgi:hypothetical protein
MGAVRVGIVTAADLADRLADVINFDRPARRGIIAPARAARHAAARQARQLIAHLHGHQRAHTTSLNLTPGRTTTMPIIAGVRLDAEEAQQMALTVAMPDVPITDGETEMIPADDLRGFLAREHLGLDPATLADRQWADIDRFIREHTLDAA